MRQPIDREGRIGAFDGHVAALVQRDDERVVAGVARRTVREMSQQRLVGRLQHLETSLGQVPPNQRVVVQMTLSGEHGLPPTLPSTSAAHETDELARSTR